VQLQRSAPFCPAPWHSRRTRRQSTPNPTRAGQDGLKVVIDPVTKRLRAPDADEAAAMSARLGQRPTTPETVVTLRNGAVALKGAPEHRDYTTVTIGTDGKATLNCTQGHGTKTAGRHSHDR
jgi:hypothetical protein